MNKQRLLALTLIIFAAAMARVLPHPVNVAPIAAIALFGGAKFGRASLAFIIPFAALLLSDAVIGFYKDMWVIYLAFATTVCIGFALRKRETVSTVVFASMLSSVVFFMITNSVLMHAHTHFPVSIPGMFASYEAALPFFRNSLLGDLFYNTLLFGGFAIAERRFRPLRTQARYA